METKICYKCGRTLEASETYFYKHPKNKDGLGTRCKECLGQKFKVKIKAKEGYRICSSCYMELPETTEYFRKKTKEGKLEAVCKECRYEQGPEQREKRKGYMEEYYKNHKELYDKEKIKENLKRWKKDNKDKCKASKEKYINKLRKLPSTLTENQWKQIKKYFNNRCVYCGKKSKLEKDHFIPLSKGGEYTSKNIVPACQSCNGSKGSKEFETWYKTYKFYSKEREIAILDFLECQKDKEWLNNVLSQEEG